MNDRRSGYALSFTKASELVTKMLEDSRRRVWVGTRNAGLLILKDETINRYPHCAFAVGVCYNPCQRAITQTR